ncbi:uncharacterized protein [Pseudorasbora parva]|uniref:uncharacterized protein n=1 Tax=Pseudorasbora parva TaxID=51549 RepID=UPI00351E3E4F
MTACVLCSLSAVLLCLSVYLSTIDAGVVAKPGECPSTKSGAGTCAELCVSDHDCPNNEKCCSNGCGRQCMAPYTVKPAAHLPAAEPSLPAAEPTLPEAEPLLPSSQPPVPESDPSSQPPVPESEPSSQPPVPESEPSSQPPVPESEPSAQPPVPESEPSAQPPVPTAQPPVAKSVPAAQPPVPAARPLMPKSVPAAQPLVPKSVPAARLLPRKAKLLLLAAQPKSPGKPAAKLLTPVANLPKPAPNKTKSLIPKCQINVMFGEMCAFFYFFIHF